jgi:hypothetical protein
MGTNVSKDPVTSIFGVISNKPAVSIVRVEGVSSTLKMETQYVAKCWKLHGVRSRENSNLIFLTRCCENRKSHNFCFVACQEFYDLELASTNSSLNKARTKDVNYSLATQNTLQTRVFDSYF